MFMRTSETKSSVSINQHKTSATAQSKKLTNKKVQSNTRDSNVKYTRIDALSLWHQQKSTTVAIHGPLQTRGETRCPGGIGVSCLAIRTRHECPRQRKCIYGGLILDMDRRYIGSVSHNTPGKKA